MNYSITAILPDLSIKYLRTRKVTWAASLITEPSQGLPNCENDRSCCPVPLEFWICINYACKLFLSTVANFTLQNALQMCACVRTSGGLRSGVTKAKATGFDKCIVQLRVVFSITFHAHLRREELQTLKNALKLAWFLHRSDCSFTSVSSQKRESLMASFGSGRIERNTKSSSCRFIFYCAVCEVVGHADWMQKRAPRELLWHAPKSWCSNRCNFFQKTICIWKAVPSLLHQWCSLGIGDANV